MSVVSLKTVAELTAPGEQYHGVEKRFEFVAHNWFSPYHVPILNCLNAGLKPQRVLEVGSWMGASARYFALHSGAAEVICVDHWDRNKVENWVPGTHPEDWMDFMFEHFLANCVHSGTAEKIKPFRSESLLAALSFHEAGDKFDLIYLDAAHKTEAVYADLRAYRTLLRPGGILCGDDYGHNHIPGEDVKASVDRYAAEINGTAIGYGNFWWLHF